MFGRYIRRFEWRRDQRMGRSDVAVRVIEKIDVSRELSLRVNLWCGVTVNERMDWLVEKATEMGAASLQPLHTSRTAIC